MRVVVTVARVETSGDPVLSPAVHMGVTFSGLPAWEEFIAEFGDEWVLPMTVDLYKAKVEK